jgi:pyruvate dehydrogenase E1 component
MNEAELREFRTRFGIPIADEALTETPFYKPPPDSPEARYVAERLEAMGGSLPKRSVAVEAMATPDLAEFQEFLQGSGGRDVSTTMGFARMLGRMLALKDFGKHIVPVIPDEARTFGLEALFRTYGIYSHVGQLYEPADKSSLLYYYEAKNGQLLEEGITEAGAMSSFIAAGTAYATHGINMVPFFIYYSMFGFQRVGDLIWAAGDMRARGFMLGATAGRTTLEGEGLQHQDGQSHLAATAVPTIAAYDPAYVYELAVIIHDGLKRMYHDQEALSYYLTLYNEPYPQPPLPPGAEDGIREGLYKLRASERAGPARAQLVGAGPILREVLRAQDMLGERYGIKADVWSATSFKTLRFRALEADRWNALHPEAPPRESYLEKTVRNQPGVWVAASDYVRLVSEQIAPWLPGGLTALGTDGFGRSDVRPALRRYFEVDAEAVVLATLYALHKRGELEARVVAQAIKDLNIDPEKVTPWLG